MLNPGYQTQNAAEQDARTSVQLKKDVAGIRVTCMVMVRLRFQRSAKISLAYLPDSCSSLENSRIILLYPPDTSLENSIITLLYPPDTSLENS